VTYSIVNDPVTNVNFGVGVITNDPLFKKPDAIPRNLHLEHSSPAISTGRPNSANTNVRSTMGRFTIAVEQLGLSCEPDRESDYKMSFTPTTFSGTVPVLGLPAGAKIEITFPSFFNLITIRTVESTTMDGNFGFTVNGDTVSIRRSGGSITTLGDPEDIILRGIGLSETRSNYVIRLVIRDTNGRVIQQSETSVDFRAELDNIQPSLEFLSPRNRSLVGNTIGIFGRIFDANLDEAELIVRDGGGDVVTNHLFISNSSGLLLVWNTENVEGSNSIELLARDACGNSNRIETTVFVSEPEILLIFV